MNDQENEATFEGSPASDETNSSWELQLSSAEDQLVLALRSAVLQFMGGVWSLAAMSELRLDDLTAASRVVRFVMEGASVQSMRSRMSSPGRHALARVLRELISTAPTLRAYDALSSSSTQESEATPTESHTETRLD